MGSVYEEVASLKEFPQRSAKSIEVQGRSICLFHVDGQVYALDERCYHAGGPLHFGDIEDVGGKLCIRCPWHSYKIVLATGESLYQAMDKSIVSKGVKQRTHQVMIQDDKVLVCVDSPSRSGNNVESDHYCPETYEEKVRMGLAPRKV